MFLLLPLCEHQWYGILYIIRNILMGVLWVRYTQKDISLYIFIHIVIKNVLHESLYYWFWNRIETVDVQKNK